MLPFTRDQFFQLFADYNAAVWPAQIVAWLAGLAMVVLVMRPSRRSDRIVGAGLALMWAWTGIAYHAFFFSSINPVARLFGALFVVQAAALLHATRWSGRLRFGASSGPIAWLGAALVAYAMVLYPIVGLLAGHAWPAMPMFGITPCPVTLFTFGLLLLTTAPVPRGLLAIPLAWSLVGGSAAALLGVPQDWVLLASGLSALPLVVRDRRAMRAALRA